MLMSFLELRPNPGPMTSSTPKKSYSDHEELTNGSMLNGISCPDSPTEVGPLQSVSPLQMNDSDSLISLTQTMEPASAFHQTADQSGAARSLESEPESQCTFEGATFESPILNKKFEVNPPELSTNTSYTTLKKRPLKQNNLLKQRLLAALVNLIPHRETLALRLLVNYTIDDKDSESIVIDETLCRQSSRPRNKTEKPSLDHSADSGCIAEERHLASKRPRSDSHHPADTHVLDLSVHTECDELELEEAMNTEIYESAEESIQGSPSEPPLNAELRVLHDQAAELNASVSTDKAAVSGPLGTMNPLMVSSSPMNGNSSAVFTASPFPPVDSSLLTLLPLLQQQLPQSNIRVFGQPKVFPTIDSSIPMNVSNNRHPTNGSSTNSMTPETAESILFRELQALIRSNSSMNRVGQEVPLDSSVAGVKVPESVGNCVVNQTMPSLLNTPLNTSSLVGFPLFSAFAPDQLTAVQALFPPASLLNNALSVPNITSLNLGSATLLNLKDKNTGQETLGIMQGANRYVSTPVANLLNHISIPQATSISLKTLSTLSQLFGSSSEQNCSKLSGLPVQLGSLSASGDSRPMKTEMFRVSEKRHNDNPVDPVATTQPDELRQPNSTISIPINQDGAAKSSFIIPDPRIPQSSPLSVLGNSDTSLAAATNGLSSSAYGSNQFIFGRRLAHTRRFTCNQCRKNFASLAELNRHTLEAHNSFKCTICSAHFTQRSNLQRHSLKHVGFKPFTCNLCKKEYYRKDHLVRHIEVTHPNHDPKMNITVHLTSSECLDYLDRLHAGKQTPSPCGSELPEVGLDTEVSEFGGLKIEETFGDVNGDEVESSPRSAPNPVQHND